MPYSSKRFCGKSIVLSAEIDTFIFSSMLCTYFMNIIYLKATYYASINYKPKKPKVESTKFHSTMSRMTIILLYKKQKRLYKLYYDRK